MVISFNEKCYKALRKVPKGKVTTYKGIGKSIRSKGYRAVGNAMNKNPYAYSARVRAGGSDLKRSELAPCHRVVNSDGSIGGFASGPKKKIRMLKAEGVEVKNDKVDLEKFGYKF